MTKKISAIILTKNEADIITDCLESVKWTDEIVVVDHGSIDQTIELVKKFGVKKIINASPNSSFADRRNLGAKNATGKWLLYVDADERVTPLLRQEIEKITITQTLSPITGSAFAIPRKNIRLTKVLKYGGWSPDYVLRLINKSKLVKWEGDLHEQPVINGEVGKLTEALVHFSHRGSYEHKFNTTVNWSKIEAQKLLESNHPPMTILRFLSAMWREFYKRMFKFQAYKDGTEGILEAIYQVFSVFITYARLWELQQEVKSLKLKVKS